MKTLPPYFLLLLPLLPLVAGCSSQAPAAPPDAAIDASTDARPEGGDAAASVPPTPEEILCRALASRTQCPNSGSDGSCSERARCVHARNKDAAAVPVYAECIASPSCRSTDTCDALAGVTVGGQAAKDYVAACSAKLDACPKAFDPEYCTSAVYAYTGAGALAAGCVAKACGEVGPCLGGLDAYVSRGCP